jgi:hypothetical protein
LIRVGELQIENCTLKEATSRAGFAVSAARLLSGGGRR